MITPGPITADLVLDLHNNRYTRFDIATVLKNLPPSRAFGFILPRIMLQNITQPYLLEEMDYDTLDQDASTTVAQVIYKFHDAVMIRSLQEPHNEL
jgi:hypothetical protein